jgi:hypothetical protein
MKFVPTTVNGFLTVSLLTSNLALADQGARLYKVTLFGEKDQPGVISQSCEISLRDNKVLLTRVEVEVGGNVPVVWKTSRKLSRQWSLNEEFNDALRKGVYQLTGEKNEQFPQSTWQISYGENQSPTVHQTLRSTGPLVGINSSLGTSSLLQYSNFVCGF